LIQANKQRALICTGFHRSATSATANYLANAGLDMGSDLVAAHISNAKGHFEDLQAVQTHDKQLHHSDTSWQFHDEVKLVSKSGFLDEYCYERSLVASHWGVKDPRVCLFLDEWNESLSGNGSFLFVVRHWSGCIESLLNRHSRELAYGLNDININNVHFKHWIKPELSAKMWLTYNKRMLAFAKQYPDKVLLCTQRALFEGAPIISKLNQQFGFNLDEEAERPFDSTLFNDEAYESIRNSLSSSIKAELDTVWQALLKVADFKSADEKPLYKTISDLPATFYQEYISALNNLAKPLMFESSSNIELSHVDIFQISDVTNEPLFIDWLISIRSKTLSESHLSEIDKVIGNASGKIHLEYGRTLQSQKYYEKAIHHYHKCIALGVTFPFAFMLQGQCYQAIDEFELALFCFNKALEGNPKNPTFYLTKGNLFSILDENKKAEQVFLEGINLLGYLVPLVINYSDFLVSLERHEEAVNLLTKADIEQPAVQHKMAQVKMLINFHSGIDSYYEMTSKRLKSKNKMRWLATITKHLTGANEEKDFLIRCFLHWKKLDKL
jgi:tetratricopeptide (TPR) repeat protein